MPPSPQVTHTAAHAHAATAAASAAVAAPMEAMYMQQHGSFQGHVLPGACAAAQHPCPCAGGCDACKALRGGSKDLASRSWCLLAPLVL